MTSKLMSVVDDIRIHHLFDDGAKVDYRIDGDMLLVTVDTETGREVVAKIAMTDKDYE